MSASSLSDVYSRMLVPDDFLRASGELFALRDSGWKSAKNRGLPLEGPIKEFVEAGLAHLDALDVCGLCDEALMTMTSMLLSVDMSAVEPKALGSPFVELYVRFIEGCVSLCHRSEGDSFAEPHAKAILSQAAALFKASVEPFDCSSPKITGILESCRADGGQSVNKAQLLVDIFSRLHALG